MNIKVVGVVCVAVGIMAFHAVGVVTDETIRSRLEDVLMNDHGYRDDAESVLVECGGDSNRFVRIAKTIFAESESPREKTRLVSLIARYASPSDVVFMESCVTDVNIGLPALSGVLRLQGVCSNSVAQVARFHQTVDRTGQAPALRQQKGFAVVNLFREPGWSSSTMDGKALAWNYACSYVSNNVGQVGIIDEAMRRADSSYGISRRRLSLLRWVDSQTLTSETKQFVTNAMNQLIAYPEANLPE